MSFTLWGGYYRPESPLDQRRLDVTLSLERSDSPERRRALRVSIDVEGIATAAPARVSILGLGRTSEYAIAFEDEHGTPYVLELVHTLRVGTLRGATELEGTLLEGPRRAFARARLRLDYRDLPRARDILQWIKT